MTQNFAVNGDFEHSFGKLPDHLLVEIFIRLPPSEFFVISCVMKQWATLLRGEPFWNAALVRNWPYAGHGKKWHGPIFEGHSKRRYMALHVTRNLFPLYDEIDEIMGHAYLFLTEQLLKSSTGVGLPTRLLHETVIDQFISCGKSRDVAHELASHIWLAVINNLEENEMTFQLLKHLAGRVERSPGEYNFSYEVQGRIFEKAFHSHEVQGRFF